MRGSGSRWIHLRREIWYPAGSESMPRPGGGERRLAECPTECRLLSSVLEDLNGHGGAKKNVKRRRTGWRRTWEAVFVQHGV